MACVRPFRLSDYAKAADLLQDVLSEACFEETIEAFGRQLSWDSELVLVATEGQEIVGVIIGTIDDNDGYFYRIAVARPYQRKGIGRSLIAELGKRFARREVRKVWVTLDNHNESFLPFYESLGFGSMDFLRSVKRLRIVNG
jgi:ribosomal protein S18 acetylase RimI-like enzyme